MTTRKWILGAAIIAVGAALFMLILYSIDRTSWAFSLYEFGRPGAERMGNLAAWVIEVAAISLIISEVVINKADHPAEYRMIMVGLCAILILQGLANGVGGWINGWVESRRRIGEGNFATFVAGVLWFVTNMIIPAAIFLLSKLEAWLIRQLVALLDTQTIKAIIEARDKFMAEAAALATDLAKLTNHADRWISRWMAEARRYRDLYRGKVAELDASRAAQAQAERDAALALDALESAEIEREQLRDSMLGEINSLQDQIEAMRAAPLPARPPVALGDVIDFLHAQAAAGAALTIGDIARSMLAYYEGNKSQAAAALGTNFNTFSNWLRVGAQEVAE